MPLRYGAEMDHLEESQHFTRRQVAHFMDLSGMKAMSEAMFRCMPNVFLCQINHDLGIFYDNTASFIESIREYTC